VREVDPGRRRVDAHEEEASGFQRGRGPHEVRRRVGFEPMLKDLDRDEVVEGPVEGEVAKIRAGEPGR
jgi:hypothetical protein